MRTIILCLILPAVSWSLNESELKTAKDEKYQFVVSACQENSFLRGCFHLNENDCTADVKKSFEGCWKFLEKRVDINLISLGDWQNKIDGCTLRDVGLQSKFQAETTARCALPKKDVL